MYKHLDSSKSFKWLVVQWSAALYQYGNVWLGHCLILTLAQRIKMSPLKKSLIIFRYFVCIVRMFVITRFCTLSRNVKIKLFNHCNKMRGGNQNTHFSYGLQIEYRKAKGWYSWVIFTRKYWLCANQHVQNQSTKMTSQYQCLAFADIHVWDYVVLLSHHSIRLKKPSFTTMVIWAISDF